MIIRSIISIVLVIVMLPGCDRSAQTSIPSDKMTAIIRDIMLADKYVREHPLLERDSVRDLLTQSLLKVHKLSRAELDSNIYLYQVDMEKYQALLQDLGEVFVEEYSKSETK